MARKSKLFTNIVTPFAARLTLAAVLAGIWRNHVAHLHIGNAAAHRHNLAAELVSENDAPLLARKRMAGPLWE